jgi:hypothetical protein
MAQLHITNLQCVRRQDPVGRDETRIQQLIGGARPLSRARTASAEATTCP